jgi:flagella basal body P-ring formation protein FlgA
MESLAVAALTAALALPGARVELLEVDPSLPRGCEARAASAPAPVAASGRGALRLTGARADGAACEGWGWARFRVLAPALAVTRDLAAGDALAGDALAASEREVRPGHPPVAEVPPGATAARALRAGTALEPQHVRAGPRPGEPVTVVVRSGALQIEQPGRAVACARGTACALLPSGRRVEGRLDGGRLLVESP